jgi:soluble lytic murein transglycosylase-like protein
MLGNACFNIKVGAWILSQCVQGQMGNTWEAIGCYNASSAGKRAQYASKIYNIVQKQGDIPKVGIFGCPWADE